MKFFICTILMICFCVSKSLSQPCPGPMSIATWDNCVSPCGSTSDFNFYVYTDQPDPNVTYSQGFIASDCFQLPTGWSLISTYADNVTIGSIPYQRHRVTLRPSQFGGNGAQGKMRTKAYCTSTPTYSSWVNFTIQRSVSTGARNLTGSSIVCSGNPVAFSLSTQTGDVNYSWSTGSNAFISSGQGTTSTQIGSSGNGSSIVYVNFNDGCANSISRTASLYSGVPQVYNFTVNYQSYNYSTNGQICTGSNQYIQADVAGSTSSNWSITSGNSYNASLSAYGNQATFSPYGSGYFNLSSDFTNSCGTGTGSIHFDAYDCYARYSTYPNPARDQVSIEFTNIESEESLPEQIDVLSEKSTKPVISIDVQQAYKAKTLESGNKIEINTKELPRGTYYLRVKNSKRKEKPVESIRVVLE